MGLNKTDKLLEKFFERERWERAIDIALDKKIDKAKLRKLMSPDMRLAMYEAIKNDNYLIAPPRQQKIPKDNGDFRIVYINEDLDRIFLSIANELFFELCGDMIHPSCKSYQSGIGCGKIVQEVSRVMQRTRGIEVGVKNDLTKYFDSVPIGWIDYIFDEIEKRTGKSKIIDVVRAYYHQHICFDTEGNIVEKYQSLKQGCAVASFLADAVLYHIDESISQMNVMYVRYSDDILIVGPDWRDAEERLAKMLSDMMLTLNPKKVEVIRKNRWFKFLGFNIKNHMITLSKSRVKDFQKTIMELTIKDRNNTVRKAVNKVLRFLYIGDGHYSWAIQVLPVINVERDIQELNKFVMDCIRAVETGNKKVAGLGSVMDREDYTIVRGTGRHVTGNRQKTTKNIQGYKSLRCMQVAIFSGREVYEAIIRRM